jgi:phenylalanyl-tRNA synthetase beta chain
MPLLIFDKAHLIQLVGKKLSDEQIEEIINKTKTNVERIDEKEIEVEITGERIDLFSIEGFARMLRQFLGLERGLPRYKVRKSNLKIKVEKVEARPFAACAIVKNVKLDNEFIKSLIQVQEILHSNLGKDRKKVAIGLHDFDKIFPPITYTEISPNAKLVPLGMETELMLVEILEKHEKGIKYGKLVKSFKKWPVFLDKKGIFSFPPIINSERTKITKKTKNIFIDVTGLNEDLVDYTLNLLVSIFAERKANVESVELIFENRRKILPNFKPEKFSLNKKEVFDLLGIKLKDREIKELFEKVGFEAKVLGNKISVMVPFYRKDILHRVDLIEELAIAYGYENFEPEVPEIATIGSFEKIEKISDKVREVLASLGLIEVMRPVLTNFSNQFDKMNLERIKCVELKNPVSENYTCLRTWLLPSLLEVLSRNKHIEYPQNLFEVGDVVLIDETKETKTLTHRKVAGLVCHSKASFAEIKAIVEVLLSALKVVYKFKNFEHKSFIEGRCGLIIGNGKEVGIFGEIHPKVLENWEIEMPVAAFEINLEDLLC